MICPLRMVSGIKLAQYGWDCVKENCEWWVADAEDSSGGKTGKCAVFVIGQCTSDKWKAEKEKTRLAQGF